VKRPKLKERQDEVSTVVQPRHLR